MPEMLRPPANAPRSWHEWYARANHFFWLPCPLCGECFGGHEWDTSPGVLSSIPDPDHPGMGTGICPACTKAGRGVDLFEWVWSQPQESGEVQE
jgi:hypothetical protein